MPPARRASRDDGRCSRTTDRDWRARTRKQDYGGRYDRHHLTCDERPANGHKMRRGGRHYNAPRQLFPDGGQDHRYPRSARCRQGGEMPCDRDDRPWANNNNNSNYWKPAQQPAQTPHQPYNAFHPNNYDSYNENGNGCNTPVTWHGYQGGSRQQAHCTPQQQQQQQGWQGPQQQQQQGWQGPQQGWAPQPEPPPHQPQQQQGWQEPQQGWAAQPAPSPHQSQFTPNWPSQHHRPHHQQPQQAYQQQKAYHQQHPPYYQQQPPQQQQPYSWPSNGDSFHGECVTYPNHPHYLNPSRDPRQSAPGRQQEWSQRHVTPVQLQDSDPSQEPDQSFQPEQHWRHHHQEEPQRWPQSCSSSSDRLQQAVASVRPWRLETPAASSDPERCRPEASENTLTAQQLKNLSANAIARYRTNSPPRGSATTPKRSRWDQRRPSTPKKTDACSSGPSSRVDAAPSRPASRTDASSSGPSSRADAAPSRPASRTDASSLGPSSRADATPSRPASRTDATPSKPASRTDASSSGPSSRVDATPSRPASRTDATPSKPASRTDATPSRPASRTDASSSGPSSRADATPSRPASRTDATPSRPASRTDASNTRPSSRTDPSNTRPSSQTDASNARPGSRTDTVSSESSSRADAATSRSPLPKSSRSASAATEVQPPPSIPDIPQPPSGACSRPPRSDAVLPEPPSGIPDIPQPPSGACSRPPRSDAVLPEPPSGIVMEAGIPLASSTSSRVSGQSEAAGTSKRRKSEADTLPDADPAHVKSKRSSQSSSSKSTPQSSRSSSSKSKKPRSSSHSRSRHKSKRPERSVSAKSSSKKESKTKSLSSSKMSSSTDKQPKEDLGKSSNSVLNPPKFNANFRIPKTTKLPNPLLQIKEAPKSAKKTTTTWLQQGSTPKPAAPGSKIHLTPRASEEDNELMNILMGETDVDLAEEVRAARRHKRAGSSCPSKKSDRKKTKLKETELVKPSTKTKTHPNSEENAGRSRSSDERPSCKTRSRPTTPKMKRRSRKDSEESEWTPPKRSKSAAKSLCSNSSSEPPSPPQSGIASRTRSRTRSPSSKMPNPVGFSDPYASSDSDDDDDKIIESSWTDETMAHWAKDIGTSEVEKSPPSGLEEVFKRLQRDNRKKKEIVYAQTANYTTLSNCQTSEGSLLASPQMPVLLVEDEISPANRQEMPNITRTPSTGPSIGNLTPSAHSVSSPNERLGMTLVPLEREVPHAITALPQEREGPLASEEIVLDDISEDPDDVEVLGRARCPPSPSLAEFIDLEDQPEIDVHLPIQELWSRLPPSRRHTIETFEDTLKLANSSIVKFVEEFTEAEKIKTRSLREEQFQTLRDEFRAKFSLSYGRTENAFLVLLNYFKEKDLYCILRKRLCCTTDLSDPQSSLDDMRTLIQTVMSSSKLELTRNCSCNVSLAAKLFNMHRTKKEYQTDLNGPVKSTGLRVQGVEPLPLKNQAGESGAKVTESTSNKRPRTPSRDSGYTSPPRVVEPPNEDPVVSDDDSDLFVCIQCKEVATIRCPACPEMFYCSTECQKEHWVTHIETCGYRNLPSPQN